jgi:hypothetical protein
VNYTSSYEIHTQKLKEFYTSFLLHTCGATWCSAVNKKTDSFIMFPSNHQADRREENGKNEEFYTLKDKV